MADAKAQSRPRSLEARIHDHYAKLPASERKLADLILDFPGEVSSYSATELAELAGASKAAATRLIQRLGFESFDEARRLARSTKQWGSPLYLHPRDAGEPNAETVVETLLADNVEALTKTFQSIEPAELETILGKLVEAERIWLLGFRNSHYVASFARGQLIQFRSDVHLLPAAGETLAESLAELTPRDLLFVVGVRRRVSGLRRVMKIAGKAGTPILYLTDPTARRTPQLATWTLRCVVQNSAPFDSYVGPVGLVHLLSVLAMKRAGQAGRRHLERIELNHEILADFG